MITPTFTQELRLLKDYQSVAGIDEVGRGPLAGPVVAAAVILNPKKIGKYRSKSKWWRGVRDSKTLTAGKRRALAEFIRQNILDSGIGLCTHEEIDDLNIHNASLLAMYRAIENLKTLPDVVFLDGKFILPRMNIVQKPIVDGDAHVLSIATASILAKVYRDDLMVKYSKQFPQFGFAQHKGYDTAFHRKKLFQYGPCEIHRLTFETVKMAINQRFVKMLKLG